MKWYFQQTHHDVWDYDSGGPPILFDMQVRGQRVKALAEASKNGFLYILNRETGQPVHPIKEMPVPTADHAVLASSRGRRSRFRTRRPESRWVRCRPSFPVDIPPERAGEAKARAAFHAAPARIRSWRPARGGGANYGPLSYSPRTGLLYVNAIDDPTNSGRPPKGYFSAFDPTTGELAWQQTFEGYGQAGSVVTAGGLVFVGSGSNVAGYFFAYRREDRRAAVEVQHRRRRVLVALHLHGQRRAVRDRGVGRRRPRPTGRRFDSQLRAAEAVSQEAPV